MEVKKIYLAGGCFWGTEHFMGLLPGVIDTQVGYANSIVPSPTYKDVCSGETNAAETVEVTYDPGLISLAQLLRLFFKSIDPTSINRQGGDHGTQYRTGIYYTDAADIAVIDNEIARLSTQYSKPIAIEVMPLENFYPAEEYHQDYLDKNPGGYCHVDPSLFALARKLRENGNAL